MCEDQEWRDGSNVQEGIGVKLTHCVSPHILLNGVLEQVPKYRTMMERETERSTSGSTIAVVQD